MCDQKTKIVSVSFAGHCTNKMCIKDVTPQTVFCCQNIKTAVSSRNCPCTTERSAAHFVLIADLSCMYMYALKHCAVLLKHCADAFVLVTTSLGPS